MLGRGQRAAAALGTRMPRETEVTMAGPPVEAPASNEVDKPEDPPDEGGHEAPDEPDTKITEQEEKAALLGAIIPVFNHLSAPSKEKLRKEYGTDISKLSIEELRNMDKDVKKAAAA